MMTALLLAVSVAGATGKAIQKGLDSAKPATTTTAVTTASDYSWIEQLTLQARKDPATYRRDLARRFNVIPAKVDLVVKSVSQPGEAYMVLRLCELSARPTDVVLKQVRASKSRGWGVVAKNLGIKPGSADFHALKRGHDLNRGKTPVKGKEAVKPKGPVKARNSGKTKATTKNQGTGKAGK